MYKKKKFMTSPTGKQIITVHILLNISGKNVIEAMKFGQLIEYNRRNIFLEDHKQSEVEKLVLDAFLTKTKLSIFPYQCSELFLFIVCPSRVLSKYFETKVLTICFYLK